MVLGRMHIFFNGVWIEQNEQNDKYKFWTFWGERDNNTTIILSMQGYDICRERLSSANSSSLMYSVKVWRNSSLSYTFKFQKSINESKSLLTSEMFIDQADMLACTKFSHSNDRVTSFKSFGLLKKYVKREIGNMYFSIWLNHFVLSHRWKIKDVTKYNQQMLIREETKKTIRSKFGPRIHHFP